MAILSQALWRDFPEYYSVFQTPDFAWRRGSGRNHNRLLGQVEGVDGIKTGYTRASGFNLASMAERNGRRVIVVVLGGETAAARDAQVAYLIEGAYQEYARREDPGAATLASMPASRLDLPGASGVTTVATTSTYANPDGTFVETLTGAAEAIGQGDQSADEQSTDEPN
jgi:D-alanyl-D-alanine carboxypeptidase